MRTCLVLLLVGAAACGPNARGNDDTPGDDMPADDEPPGDDTNQPTCPSCSDDGSAMIDCEGNATACPDDTACSGGACVDPCEAAVASNSSVGCEYYTVDMDAAQGPPIDACYTVFVANTSRGNVHMNIDWNGTPIDLAQYAKIPVGAGQSLTYAAYDPVGGLPPGQVAIVFLAYAFNFGNVACPVPAALGTEAQLSGTGRNFAFHLTTDWPVVAYQMLPYGGGAAAATGATLLLPTSAWGTNYIAVSAYDSTAPPIPIPMGPSFNIVGREDGTTVTMRPKSAIVAGGGLPAGPADQPYQFTVNRGEYVQITQYAPLSGSPIDATAPIGVFGGHQIMSIDRCCGDHGEQMLAPVRALGYEYVAASHADRKVGGEPRIYRIFGAVDGTQLSYDPPGVGPAVVNQGEFYEVRSPAPFTVRSQDDAHPFAMFTYMSGSGELGEGGIGDPDFVRLVPPLQYLKRYVFFTDPTYPFTVLTVVRGLKDGVFHDVDLDCMGTISGWQPVGAVGVFEVAYVKLVDHWNGQGGCNNGVRTMRSDAPFGVSVWGWGSEDTSTGWVSYGYPAGESIQAINDVVIE
jgi:hypothetical protein